VQVRGMTRIAAAAAVAEHIAAVDVVEQAKPNGRQCYSAQGTTAADLLMVVTKAQMRQCYAGSTLSSGRMPFAKGVAEQAEMHIAPQVVTVEGAKRGLDTVVL